MQFSDVISNRWSVRDFDDRQVSRDTVDRILTLAQTAPTAKNMQPVRVYAVTDRAMLQKLDAVTPCRYGAQLVFAVCSDETQSWKDSGNKSRGEMDASIYTTHLMLAATDSGLGTCWVCMFDADRLRSLLDIPETTLPCCLLMAGYPSKDCRPSDRHLSRHKINETVTII